MIHSFLIFFREWRYLFLLGALLALLVVEPIATSFGIMESLFDALLVLVMAVLILALAQDKVWRVVACILCVPAAALPIGSYFFASSPQNVSLSIGHAIGAIFFLVVTAKVVHSLFTSQTLSIDSIFGAICGYMLLGVAWALIYALLFATSPDSFQVSEAIRRHLEHGEYRQYIFNYYSFVTLTTVGFGDITPLSIPARTLSWVEAMTGQLYLAVLIAGLISAMVARNTITNQRR